MTSNDQNALTLLRKLIEIKRQRDELEADHFTKLTSSTIQTPGQFDLESGNEDHLDELEREIDQMWDLLQAWHRGEDIIMARLSND